MLELLFLPAPDGNRGIWYFVRVCWVVFVHFILSFHNGWIDPRLRLYERIEEVRDNMRDEQEPDEESSMSEASQDPNN